MPDAAAAFFGKGTDGDFVMTARCGDVFDVWSASSVKDLRARIVGIAQNLGFTGIAEWNEPRAKRMAGGTTQLEVAWSNAEELYGAKLPDYFAALGETFCAANPGEVAQRRRWEALQRAPFLLSQQPDRFKENRNWLALRRDFGEPAYEDALAVPLPSDRDQAHHLYFMSCDDVSPERSGLASSLGSLYALMSGLLEPAELEIVETIETAEAGNVALKPRELEVIRWAAAGKTLEDIAVITGLAYRTVRYHLEQARKRYGYATTQQTIVRAALDYQLDPMGA